MKDPEGNDSLSSYYEKLIRLLVQLGNGYAPKVMVLIDEYDAALIKSKRNAQDKEGLYTSILNMRPLQ